MEHTFPAFVSYMEEEKHSSKSTVSSYRRDVKRLIAFLNSRGIQKVQDVTAASLNAYMVYLERMGFSTATISRNVASVKAFFHFALGHCFLETDPTEKIRAPHIDRKEPGVLSVEEAKRLLEQPPADTVKGIRDRAMLELMYAAGLRVTELVTVKNGDLNLDVGYVICREGGKERMIPLGHSSCEVLKRYYAESRGQLLKNRENEYVFVNCSGAPMSRQGFWKLIKQYAEKAGITEDITPYTLRHSFAAHMVQNGADLRAVQEMLGHADIQTTQMYVNLNLDRMRQVYQKAHPRG